MKMNKIRVTKYKLIDTDIFKDIAKKIVGRHFTVEKIKAKGGPTTKPRAKAPAWFIEFRDEQREFNTRIEKDIANLKNDFSILKNDVSSLKKTQDQQNKHLQRIDSRLDRQDERFENIEHELSI